MVSTRPPTSKSSSPLVTVPNAPITIGIIVASMFHSFLSSLARSIIIINKNKRTWRIVNFVVPANLKVKLKESIKKEKYLDLAR